jgi:hypothetical protein
MYHLKQRSLCQQAYSHKPNQTTFVDIPEKLNKAIDGSEAANKAADSPTTLRAVSTLINEYFFPGGGIWKPMTIKAPSREQAEEIYKAKREPVTPEEKVEAQTENSSE